MSTLPTPSQRTISSICSRTVAGLPTIAYPPATISSQLVTFSMKSPKAPTIFRAERAEVYPGGVMLMPGRSFRAKYQRRGSNSARARASLSAT